MTVYWAVLLERAVIGEAVDVLLDVAGVAAVNGYVRISLPYMRTDDARNAVVDAFMKQTDDPDDVLVMLDNDHRHPVDIIQRLAQRSEPVVGALAFRRGYPHDPMWFVRDKETGFMRQPAEWERGAVYRCEAVGTGAIAIKRQVFNTLKLHGFTPPYFKYTYPQDIPFSPSEDMYFAELCEKSGVNHHVHTGVEIPHLTIREITQETWESSDKYMEVSNDCSR